MRNSLCWTFFLHTEKNKIAVKFLPAQRFFLNFFLCCFTPKDFTNTSRFIATLCSFSLLKRPKDWFCYRLNRSKGAMQLKQKLQNREHTYFHNFSPTLALSLCSVECSVSHAWPHVLISYALVGSVMIMLDSRTQDWILLHENNFLSSLKGTWTRYFRLIGLQTI